MFSLRIVNVDSYQSAPTKGYDVCYSEFRGCEIFKVPIIRIFGITPAGQKGCLHVHGVFPYFSIRCKDVFPNIEAKSLRKCMQELSMDVDKALNIASRNSNSHKQHVYKIVITEQIPFYGFHEKAEEFLKIYFYNPFDISRAAELMTNGVILNKFIQPYEAHIPYILQFFIDYNLFGMNLINVSKFKFRASENDLVSAMSPLRNHAVSRILDESISSSNKVWNIETLSSSHISGLSRQTVCELEVDCCSSEIMNRLNESFSSGKNPGLFAIWEEERQRRKAENDTSQITPVPSQERTDFFETESENFYKKKLRKILETFDVYKVHQRDKSDYSSKDLKDLKLSDSNASDLSTTQDEELLNMMLSMVNSQTALLDDDSILGLNHQDGNQSENIDDETLEMSQLFTEELEESMWSQISNAEADKNAVNTSNISSGSNVNEQSTKSNEKVIIPQLDGAFDDDSVISDDKKSKIVEDHSKKKESRFHDETEASLIKSCNLMTPVVQLTPAVIIKTEIESPITPRPENEIDYDFINDDSSNSTARNAISLCVPVSRNAHCSLIMNIYENSNDVTIEHTCDSRNNTQIGSLAETEDPSDVVFEVITNLIYKVECLTEARTSCYEHLTEEYVGESYSELLAQKLSEEEKSAINQLKAAASTSSLTFPSIKREYFSDCNSSLPLKKRIYSKNWDTNKINECSSCTHSVSLDFSKIGREVVVLRKLSESDFINYVKLNSLKVVIPPLPLQTNDDLKTSVLREEFNNSILPSSNLMNSKNSKMKNKKISKCNDFDAEKFPVDKIESTQFKKENVKQDIDSAYMVSSKNANSTVLPSFDLKRNVTDTSVTQCAENIKNLEQNQGSIDCKVDNNNDLQAIKPRIKSLDCDQYNSDHKEEIITNEGDKQTLKPLIHEMGEKKCTTLSELRLYRRKKSLPGYQVNHQRNEALCVDYQHISSENRIDSRSRTVDSKMNKYVTPIKTPSVASAAFKSNATSLYVPVVRLEQCEDLIEKYCGSDNIDSDCLILGEIFHGSKTLPLNARRKRLSRTCVKQETDQVLDSKTAFISQISLADAKFKGSKILPAKEEEISLISDSEVETANIPCVRKRSASSNSSIKKKLASKSKHKLLHNKKHSSNKTIEQDSSFQADFLNVNGSKIDYCDKKYSPESNLENKLRISVPKKSVSCKLSLKLNKKKCEKFIQRDSEVPADSDSLEIISNNSNNSSSFVLLKDDESQPKVENLYFTKKLKKYVSKNKKMHHYQEKIHNSISKDMNAGVTSDYSVDWSIDDIPLSQLKTSHSLKCTISKKKPNAENNVHEFDKVPIIPKLKVSGKNSHKSVNLSIKVNSPPLDLSDNDPDFKPNNHNSSKRKKASKKSNKSSKAFRSALGIKQKYKKNEKSKNKYLKTKCFHSNYSPDKNNKVNSSPMTPSKENVPQSIVWKQKLDSPSLSSCNSCSTPKNEISDISNLSPFTEDNSNDSKRSKNSLKIKLKLKRIMTRSNGERIVVVGKELEGVDEENDSESIEENHGISKSPKNISNDKQVNLKKSLGTKGIKFQEGNSNLKAQFKCPLRIKDLAVKKSKKSSQINMSDHQKFDSDEKMHDVVVKPLLTSISKDLLVENTSDSKLALSSNVNSPKTLQKYSVISPKKKSPLKIAESVQKELADLNEMLGAPCDSVQMNFCNISTKNIIPSENCSSRRVKSKDLTSCEDKVDLSPGASPTHSRLRERKSSVGCKISSRKNSLICQDFKKFFDSDNDDSISSGERISRNNKNEEKANFVLPECKPCSVRLQRLSPLEIEKYIFKPILRARNAEKIMACEPSVLSVPSPIVDFKGTDSNVDPAKMFENLFNFPFACNSPLKYNKCEASPITIESDKSLDPFSNECVKFNKCESSPLTIENDKSLDSFSNDNSENIKKKSARTSSQLESKRKRPCEVFKSVEREDMGILWNLAYLSPVSVDIPLGSPPSCISPTQGDTKDTEKNEFYTELDHLEKLANKADELCSEINCRKLLAKIPSVHLMKDVSCNLMELESENSLSMLNDTMSNIDFKNVKESKVSFKNILLDNESSSNFENLPLSNQKSETEEPVIRNESDRITFASIENEVTKDIKEETKLDKEPVFEPMESLPNVRILDFQECLVESDSEMNPLLNDSEIESVMNSADIILSNSIDAHNYEQCLQTDISFDDSDLNINKPKCASKEPKNNELEDVLIKSSSDSAFQKQLDADLTCNDAIITAADTSSLLIPSYKNNTIPVLAINNSCQDENINFAAFDEQNANGQFFPIMLTSMPLSDNVEEYIEASATAVKESTSSAQDCVNFLEDNELLQSCSVSSTSDIENKSTQASNVLGLPFNGEEDILSMIVKSCDIGEEFDVNMNCVDETDNGDISSIAVNDNFIASNYIMAESDIIISSQSDKNNSVHANSENAVSSSSENNVLEKKKSEILVIKTDPVDVPNVPNEPLYEFQNSNVNYANKTAKSEELDDNVLLDSMIHSFYGDDSLYGLHSSVNCDNLSLLCSTLQSSNFSPDIEKISAECSSATNRAYVTSEDVAFEPSGREPDSFSKYLPGFQPKIVDENESFALKNTNFPDKMPIVNPNSFKATHPFQKMSSKRFYFIPSCKPPSREMIENLIKSETDLNNTSVDGADEDSLSSVSSQACTNDNTQPDMFNKAPPDGSQSTDSQKFHSSTRNTPHVDGKPFNNSPILYRDNNLSKLTMNDNLISTPSTSNVRKVFPLPDVVVSPINKESGLTIDTHKRKRKLIFDDDSKGHVKMYKPDREKIYSMFNKFRGNNSLNQSLDSLGNLSFTHIEGPTLDNSRGFKVGSDNYGDACVRHEVQHLTVMSLEIHVNTRNDLRPDPKFDSVTAIFYCIYNDIGIKEEEEIIGMIVIDPSSHHQTAGQNSSETLRNYLLLCPGVKNGFIYCVENELALFERLVTVVKEWDPDILIGYEIQMSSWGYLIERAEILNINLRLLISRLVDKNETKIVQVEPDHTVTDQTADLSRLHITGRIVLCVWRLMRKEITLNVYTFENVYYHVLHKRTPLYAFHDLTNWFLGSHKEKVIRYYVIRVQGCLHLLEKLDVIGRTSELARLFGIQFYEVLSRGSQFRVESMMLRTAAPLSYIPVSPSVRQRSHSRAPECVPLILEPESRFYIDPVVVLDFQSLYPSMIIAYNYCFSTCLGRVEHFGKNVPFEFGCTSLSVPVSLLQKLQNDIHISPTGIAFVKSSLKRGILPSMLEEILNTRVMVKQSMKKIKDNSALKKLLDARQMGLKLIANVTYGYTGATFSGRMPSVEVADSIVGKARETLERAIHLIENTSKWRAKVIYGDTDSLFILLPGRTRKQAFEIGQEIADAVTADNPKPVKLKFEKVYLPCVLETKKRYVGFMYETVDQEKPEFDAKGIETVRRDSCSATAKILEKSLKILFKSYDVQRVKNYVQTQFSKLLSGRASIIDCIFAKEYRGISGYKPGACVPALEIAKKRLAKDPRSEPRVGERVPYVVVYGFPGLPIIQLVREPIDLLKDVNLRINASYYITRVISPPLERVFNLLGADVKSWYTNLARTFKPTLPMTRAVNQHRGTLSQYFASLSCPSCEKPTFSAICDDCREDLQGTTVTLNEKIRQWERTVDHVTQICGSCTKSASSIDYCISVDCPMLFKLNVAKKDLSQAPYLRKVLAHELF